MHILHLDTGRSMRGGQYQALLLLAGLREQGHSQSLLARAPLLKRWPGRPIGVSTLLREAADADLIHAHDARAHTLAAFWRPGKPLVVSRRVAFNVGGGIFSRWKYSRPRRFLAVSEHVAGKLREAGVAASKIEVVRDAVEPPAEGKAAERPSGRVVAALSDDPLKEGALLESAVQRAGLTLHLSTDLAADLPSAGIFAYLSACEGLGSAILLAMAHKAPVVASRVGGIPEVVEHQRTGLLVSNDAAEIADALRRFEQDPDLARGCAERAYQQVLEQFTGDIMVRRTERIYREVLGLPTQL